MTAYTEAQLPITEDEELRWDFALLASQVRDCLAPEFQEMGNARVNEMVEVFLKMRALKLKG